MEAVPRRWQVCVSLCTVRVAFVWCTGVASGHVGVIHGRADYESTGACWVDLATIVGGDLRLRGSEPVTWCKHVAEGGHVSPMSLLGKEV